LAFLADLTAHCNKLNLELQGKIKTLIEFASSVNAFLAKIKLLKSQLQHQDLKNFPQLKKVNEENYDADLFCSERDKLIGELERRFKEIKELEPILTFLSFPFTNVDLRIFYLF
jgi:hypothetical protein